MAKARQLKPPTDAEFKRFIALGQKIASRMRRSGVEMTFRINFGPLNRGAQGKSEPHT